MHSVSAPIQGTVLRVEVGVGDLVHPGTTLVILESMKMEHVVTAELTGVIETITVAVGDTVASGDALLTLRPSTQTSEHAGRAVTEVDVDAVRHDHAEVRDRHERTLDARRPDAVARRHDASRRTARENIADLLDDGSFVE